MGLDIYAYRIKKAVANDYGIEIKINNINAIHEMLDNEVRKEFKRKTPGMLRYMQQVYDNQNTEGYREEYLKFIKRLQKRFDWYKNYGFHLRPFGYDDWKKVLADTKNPYEIEKLFNKDAEEIHATYNAYFRKVNFIYQFFRNDISKDYEACIVNKSRIGNLIDLCEDVLSHKGDEDYARDNLPTTSGFFFGSTDYDDWYWHDVKDCLKQMRKLYKSMDDDDFVLWDFSW